MNADRKRNGRDAQDEGIGEEKRRRGKGKEEEE
jgi:hypothetical protein